jgi:hypothetical protein
MIETARDSGEFGDTAAWSKGPNTGYFLGYAVQRVHAPVLGPNVMSMTLLNPTWDPLMKLNVYNGEMIAFYESNSDWTITG